MKLIRLDGQWKMKRTDESVWYDATVPGSVYLDLINNNRMEDPFYRDNEEQARKLAYHDYEYVTDFNVTQDILSEENISLECEGLDTLAQIYVNEQQVMSTQNMHCSYTVDIKSYIHQGQNTLRIVFLSPLNYTEKKHEQLKVSRTPHGSSKGLSYIRKAHYMFGWDWAPKLPDMGIWRSIWVQAYSTNRLEDVRIDQHHHEEGVDVGIWIKKAQEGVATQVEVEICYANAVVASDSHISINQEEKLSLSIQSPKLWWPVGYGEQPLYTVNVRLKDGQKSLDEKSFRIGLRTLDICQQPDAYGKSFAFNINGISIFAMGANYIPEDSLLGRGSKKKTEKLLRACVEANHNCIRVWGGGIYPQDYFYDLCDELGIIVWQDLMFACLVYNMDEEFEASIRKEITQNVQRIRHHASLGLWCGNNEIAWGWSEKDWFDDVSPKLKIDYVKQFEILIPELLSQHDPETFFWGSSPSSGLEREIANSQSVGDMHYWDVWHFTKPFTEYRKTYPRFMSEFGLQSFPAMPTVETFTEAKDRNIFSYVMECHQKNDGCNEKILHYVAENYQYPKDLDSLLYASQIIQAEGIKYGVEHWRRHRGRCMGAIYWQLNDCWPVASWSSIDYYGRWKALHYFSKNFYAPILLSANEEDTRVSLHLTNDTLNPYKGTVTYALMTSDNEVLTSECLDIEVACLTATQICDMDFEPFLDTIQKQQNTYLVYTLEAEGKIEKQGVILFVKHKHFNLKQPNIQIDVVEQEQQIVLKFRTDTLAKYVEIGFNDTQAVFSDNYFDLVPGREKQVIISSAKEMTIETIKQQLKFRSLYDTY